MLPSQRSGPRPPRRRRGRLIAALSVLFTFVSVGVFAVSGPAEADSAWYTGVIRANKYEQGRCLDDSAWGDLKTMPCTFPIGANPFQNWEIREYVSQGNSWPEVTIRNVGSGRFITARGYYQGLTTTPDQGANSEWQMFFPHPGNLAVLAFNWIYDAFPVNYAAPSGYCLDANQPSDISPERPWLTPCGSDYQDWHLGY
jgi:hypothetical protein